MPDFATLSSLLNNGADPNAKDENGNTALMLASILGYRKGMELLITKGARLDEKNHLRPTGITQPNFGKLWK